MTRLSLITFSRWKSQTQDWEYFRCVVFILIKRLFCLLSRKSVTAGWFLASNSGHEIDPNYWSSVNIRAAITGYTWFVIFAPWMLLLGAVKTTELIEGKICNSHSDSSDNYTWMGFIICNCILFILCQFVPILASKTFCWNFPFLTASMRFRRLWH